MDEEKVMAEVMNLLESEPAPSALPPALLSIDIPALREDLAILVSTGKCKEAIGVNLTHEQVRRLDEKDVIRHTKRYQAYVGSKTTETLIESFLAFATKALGSIVKLRDAGDLLNELKKRLHHHKRAVESFWQPCSDMWPFSRSCQRYFYHCKTCRFFERRPATASSFS